MSRHSAAVFLSTLALSAPTLRVPVADKKSRDNDTVETQGLCVVHQYKYCTCLNVSSVDVLENWISGNYLTNKTW